MKYIVPEEINTVFYDSFKYLEEIENLILGGRYSNVDFERINVLYDTRKLHRNPELQYIHQLISELSYGQNTSNLVQQIERQTAKILTLYREYHQTIFMVDDEFAYAHLSEAILHALLVGLDKIKNPLKLASVAELIKIEGPVIHGILQNLKNQFIFQMSHNIFKDLDVKCNNIHTTYKSKTLKILNFL